MAELAKDKVNGINNSEIQDIAKVAAEVNEIKCRSINNFDEAINAVKKGIDTIKKEVPILADKLSFTHNRLEQAKGLKPEISKGQELKKEASVGKA